MIATITDTSYKGVRFHAAGLQFHLRAEDIHTRPGRKPRLFVSGEGSPVWEHPEWSIKGENAELDKAWRRYNAEEIRLQKALAERGLAILRQTEGFELYGSGELRFSRKAGCSCSCSPGLLVSGTVYAKSPLVKYTVKIGDIFVTNPSAE